MLKRVGILILLIFLFSLLGCAEIIKFDQQNYEQNKALTLQQLKTWSFNSGFFTCAMLAEPIVFPTTVRNYSDLNRLVQNPSVLTGMVRLDAIAREQGTWSDEDYRLGCFQGTEIRMTVSQVIEIIRVAYPQAAPYLPSLGK